MLTFFINLFECLKLPPTYSYLIHKFIFYFVFYIEKINN